MKKLTLMLLAISIIGPASVTAQKKKEKKVHPKHMNYFKVPNDIETNEFQIEFKNIVAGQEVAKFAAKVTNNTDGFIIWNRGEGSMMLGEQEYKMSRTKEAVFKPFDSGTKTVEAKGTGMHQEAFSAELGKFEHVPAKGTTHKAEDFDLPASKNSFVTGPFSVNLVNLSKKTDLTAAKFEVTYKGGKYAILDPSKVAVRMSNGQEFANDSRKEKMFLLTRGESKKFTLYFKVPAKVEDMQFANMQIVWNDAFVESAPKEIKVSTVEFEFDPGMTDGKN